MRGKSLEWVQSFLSSRTQEVILEGKKSSSAPMTSGVPHGSVLAPILFLCYINDLPNQVSSTVRFFADDCLLYRNINTTHDAETLQEDIDKLQTWEADWLMEFNPDKCEITRITNRRKQKIVTNYSIHEHQLKDVKGAKYLGVTIDRTLSLNEHVNNVKRKPTTPGPSYSETSTDAPRLSKRYTIKRLSGQSWSMPRRYGTRPQRKTSNLWRTGSDRLNAS